jgi:hypothetical protein
LSCPEVSPLIVTVTDPEEFTIVLLSVPLASDVTVYLMASGRCVKASVACPEVSGKLTVAVVPVMSAAAQKAFRLMYFTFVLGRVTVMPGELPVALLTKTLATSEEGPMTMSCTE